MSTSGSTALTPPLRTAHQTSGVWKYRPYLSRYVFVHRGSVGLLALLLLGATGLQFFNPLIQGKFIDSAHAGRSLQILIALGLLSLGTALCAQLVSLAETYVAQSLGWRATNQLRGDLLVHTLGLDPSFHARHTPGALLERIDGDVLLLANFFSRFVVYIVGNGLMIVAVLVLFWGIDWRVGLLMTALVTAATVCIYLVRDVAPRRNDEMREASANLMGFILERLGGAEDIRTSGAVGYVMSRFYAYARTLYRRRQIAAVMATPTNWILMLCQFGGLAVALGSGAYLFVHGAISLGTVYALVAYAQVLGRPFELLSLNLQDVQQATAGLARVDSLLRERSSIADGRGDPLPASPLSVEFDHVSFSYESNAPALRDVSFSLPPGTVAGILGRTGSGKTTISRLLLRLYDPDGGTVRLGGVDLRYTHIAELRRRIGIVTQDVQFFHGSLRDNLTLFDESIGDPAIREVLADLGLLDWCESLPRGLDTPVTGNSIGLSAGQAQLLAFARVFLRDSLNPASRPGLVILDEASSRLDPLTEAMIEQAVDRLLKGRTAIVIAHRLRTVGRADQILIMANGCVLEAGPRTVLQQDPRSRYAHMLRIGMEEVLS